MFNNNNYRISGFPETNNLFPNYRSDNAIHSIYTNHVTGNETRPDFLIQKNVI